VVLILINVGVYFFVQQGPIEFLPQDVNAQIEDAKFTYEYAAIPDELTEQEPLTLQEVADNIGPGVEPVCDISVVTADPDDLCFPDKQVSLAALFSMFLHGGLMHLGGNMLFLWIFGNNIEDHMGPIRYLVFYLLGGVAATVAHVAVDPGSVVPIVGASGAIAAVMGAYLVWFPRAPIKTIIIFYFILFRDIRAMWLLLFWFASQFFISAGSGIAAMAHVGGFVFGVLVALAVKAVPGMRALLWRREYALAANRADWDDTGGHQLGFGDRRY
jgi:membrane associated rhomboid family serine protease